MSSDRNGVTKVKTFGSCSALNSYNEKAIDVPEDFEREAYARVLRNSSDSNSISQSPFRRQLRKPVHLSPSLKDFLQVCR